MTLKDIAGKIGTLFNQGIGNLQQGIQNWATSNPQQAQNLIRFEPTRQNIKAFPKQVVGSSYKWFTTPGTNPFFDSYQQTGGQTNIPKINFTSKIKNPVIKFVAGVPESMVNIPIGLVEGAGKLNKSIVESARDVNKIAQGQKVPIQSWVRNAANAADLPVNLALLRSSSKDILTSNTLKKKAISGFQGGFKYGSTTGGLESLQNIKDTDNFSKIVSNTAKEAASRGISMGVVGILFGGLSFGWDRITGKPIIPDFLDGKTLQEANAIIENIKRVDISSLQEMAKFTDYSIKKYDPMTSKQNFKSKYEYESYVRDMAKKFGINPEQSNVKIANAFRQILDAKQAGTANGPYLSEAEARMNIPKDETKEQLPVNYTPITTKKGKIVRPSTEEQLNQILRPSSRGGESVAQIRGRIMRGQAEPDDFLRGLEEDQRKIKFMPSEPQTQPKYIPPSEFKRQANQAQGNAEINQQSFNDIFARWIGKREASKTMGVKTATQVDVPKNVKGWDVISYIENPNKNVSEETKQVASVVRNQYDELYNYAKQSGIDLGYLKDYITHIWKESPEVVAQKFKSASQKFKFSGERTFPTYEQGIEMGLTPKFTDPRQLISEYTRRLEQTKANVDLIKELQDSGLIVNKRTPGFTPINGVGFSAPSTRIGENTIREGVFYAPNKIAKVINQVFSPQESPIALSTAAKASGGVQDIMLSGGIPKTPVNAWTVAQVIKEVTAGRIKGPLKALWTSLSESGSNKYFSENADLIKEQQLNNIPISTTLNTESLVNKGTIERLFGKNMGEAWNKTVNEPTFKRFMPVLQTEFYKDTKNAALQAGKSMEESINIASLATKNFYGLTSTAANAKKSQIGKDVLSTVFFAPRYRESMINFWLNNLKALKNPLALENRTNVKFVVGATITVLAYDQLNRAFNNGRSMFDNPPGTEDKLLIPTSDGTVIGVPFLSSIATVPRALFREGKMILKGDLSGAIKDAGQTYTSSLLKPLADVAANQDYFGKSIAQDNMTTGEKYKAQGKYLLNQYVFTHPYLRELTNTNNQKDPAYQRLSRAMELPFRFYDQQSLNTKYYYGAKDTAIKGLSNQEQQAFNAIPKSDTNDPNTRILKYQIYLTYPSVFEAKQKIELETAAKTGKAIDPLYLVNYDTAKKYMRYEALPEGSQDRKAMTKAYPELTALFDVRSQYFNENPIPGQATTQKPIASSYVQSQMDAKNWNDPQVQAYLDANTQWNNAQREKLGLPPLAGYTYKPKKITFKISKAPKIKTIKLKLSKPKKIKVKKVKLPKIKKPKKVKIILTKDK